MNRNERRTQRRAERLELVLQHIESHSSDHLDVATLADMARISPYHFHRVFSSYIGEPVSCFVRRLRLEKAARLLLIDSLSITEAASRAGYATSAAFTRAFRRHFGTNPRSLVRDLLQQRPPRGERSLPQGPEFRQLPAMRVVGLQRVGGYDQAPCEAWQELAKFLAPRTNGHPIVRIGIALDWPEITPAGLRRYEACVAGDLEPQGETFSKTLAPGTYAVFTHHGRPHELQAAHEAIFWNWYPDSGLRLADGPTWHRFLEPNCGPAGHIGGSTEICVPIAAGPAGNGISKN